MLFVPGCVGLRIADNPGWSLCLGSCVFVMGEPCVFHLVTGHLCVSAGKVGGFPRGVISGAEVSLRFLEETL